MKMKPWGLSVLHICECLGIEAPRMKDDVWSCWPTQLLRHACYDFENKLNIVYVLSKCHSDFACCSCQFLWGLICQSASLSLLIHDPVKPVGTDREKKKKDHQPPNLSTNHAGSHLAVVGFCHLSNPYNHIIIFYLFIFSNAGMRIVVALVVSDGTRVPVKPLYTLTPFHSAKKNFVWNFSDFILF